MTDAVRFERIVAVNINAAITNACLFTLVEGRYRLVAHGNASTTLAGDRGVIPAVLYAVQRLEHTAQVRLINSDHTIKRLTKPSTAFIVSCGLAAPLRVQPIGLTQTYSTDSVSRACQMPFVDLQVPIMMGQRPSSGQDPYASSSSGLDVVILAGGFEDTQPGYLQTAARSLVKRYEDITRALRPAVICAGNQSELRALTQILGTLFNIRSVGNIAPEPSVERLDELQNELLTLFEQKKLVEIPGYGELQAMTSSPPISSFRALRSATTILPGADYTRLVLVDMSPDSVGVIQSDGGNSSVVGTRQGYTRSDASQDELKRWLPLGSADTELIVDLIHGKLDSISSQESTHLAYFAAAHENLLTFLQPKETAPRSELTYGDTDFIAYHVEQTATPLPDAYMVMTILDTLQPAGVTRIELDRYCFWPHLGAVALLDRGAATDINADAALHAFGVCLAPFGQGNPKSAVRLSITRANGSTEYHTIPGGVIRLIRLPDQETVEIAARCSSELKFYGKQRSLRVTTPVGPLGLIIDTRGRPLPFENSGVLWRLRVTTDLQALTRV